MSTYERTGERSLVYSAWHRPPSLARFVGEEAAAACHTIDIDWCEYDAITKKPLVLVEVAFDTGGYKHAEVTRQLAEMAGIPAVVVLYTPSADRNVFDPAQYDIAAFRVKRIAPNPHADFRIVTPEVYAKSLIQLRNWSRDNLKKTGRW